MTVKNTPARANRQQARSASTRAKLIRAGRTLFARKGYAAVGTEEIVRRAGVTRGALYHQFATKQELFLAVYETVESDLTKRIASGLGEVAGPLEAMRAGSRLFLQECRAPEVQRIVLIDGPAVLGWERWRELDEGPLAAARAGLAEAARRGTVDPRHVEVFAHALVASVTEIATMVAGADDPAAALVDAENALEELLSRMLGAR
jgi:AcrR family transcriptional regulator